jgi:hypothetical protein
VPSSKIHPRRRDFLKGGVAALGLAATGSLGMAGRAFANRHPHPNRGSIDYLDRNTYIHNMTVHTHFSPPSAHVNGIWTTGGKSQMMARGNRRYLFQHGRVYDLTDPLRPEIYNDDAFEGGQVQLAYNKEIGKWILMTGAGAPITSATRDQPGGKYEYPDKIERSINAPGLRGVRVYDATDPANIRLLSAWSCDQGDPDRTLQTGGGTHRNFYSGGKYAYLDTAPDNSFTNFESTVRYYSHCIQTIDLSDPSSPKFVSNWWVEGQRENEEDAYRRWRFHGDRISWTGLHGAMFVPRKVEDGGRYGYSSYGAFGVLIHDVSDPANPQLVGKFDPVPLGSSDIPFHTVDVARLDRGFVIGNPEPLNPDCNNALGRPIQSSWIIDVNDPANPTGIAQLPMPRPPVTAPYDTFCNKRGRFGTHNPPHMKAPGTAAPNFTCYTYFNAGLQCYDLSRPEVPRITAYFIPPQGGSLDEFASFVRDTDNVFVEWDRRLIWAMTNTGIYLLSTPELGEPVLEPMPVADWTLPGLNVGFDS